MKELQDETIVRNMYGRTVTELVLRSSLLNAGVRYLLFLCMNQLSLTCYFATIQRVNQAKLCANQAKLKSLIKTERKY